MKFGVDEAGKGPVLGPMVVCCVSGQVPPDVKDSKSLSENSRRKLYEEIIRSSSYSVEVISAREIDEFDGTINEQLAKGHARAISQCVNSGNGVVDSGQKDEGEFSRMVNRNIDTSAEAEAEIKADEKYSLVSGASIVAKVTRDRIIHEINERVSLEIGSGYPSDPRTRSFLEEVEPDYPAFTRHSWSTVESATYR